MTAASRLPLAALFFGSALSLLGNELTAIAVPWLVLTTIGTPFDTGIVAAGVTIPAVIGAIVGGVVVDRLGARTTSVVADIASALAVVAIPVAALTFGLTIPLLFGLAFAGALLDAPGMTARQVLIPELAQRAQLGLERVNGIFQSITNACVLLGPLLAGLVIVAMGPANALWLDAATFAICAVVVLLFVPRTGPSPAREGPADLLLGFRLVARDPLLRSLTLLCVAANMVGTPLFAVILPVMALDLAGNAASLGITVATFGTGLVIGSILFSTVGMRWPRRRVLVVGLLGTGVAFAAASLDVPYPVLLVVLGLGGLASGPINPIAFTILQERIPTAARGRAFGAIFGMILVGAPIGMIAAGQLAGTGGADLALVLSGGTFAVLGVVVAIRSEFTDLADLTPMTLGDDLSV